MDRRIRFIAPWVFVFALVCANGRPSLAQGEIGDQGHRVATEPKKIDTSGPAEAASPKPTTDAEREAADRVITYFFRTGATIRGKWLGIPVEQNPLDVWVTQEIITELKPDFIIEAGTFAGGSAALWATILEQVNPNGRVITIDVTDQKSRRFRGTPILQRRVDFLIGSSTAPDIVEDVKRRVAGRPALVILDSLHTKDHVLNELRAYAPLVPVGSYIIVQDGIFNGHPIPTRTGPGPYEAVEAFLAESDAFVPDRNRERFLVTNNPKGFLKRVR